MVPLGLLLCKPTRGPQPNSGAAVPTPAGRGDLPQGPVSPFTPVPSCSQMSPLTIGGQDLPAMSPRWGWDWHPRLHWRLPAGMWQGLSYHPVTGLLLRKENPP